MKRILYSWMITAIIAIALGSTTAQAAKTVVVATLGNAAIRLPAPNGFADPSEDSPTLARLARTLTPPSNIAMALFLSHTDIRQISKGKLKMDRYMMVQVYGKTQYQNITAHDFKKFKQVLTTQQESLSKKAADGANKHFKNVQGNLEKITRSRVDIKIGEVVPLGIFHEDKYSIGMAMFTKIKSQGKEKAKIITATTALIKGKLVFLYVYSRYRSKKDLNWAKRVAKQWLNQVKRANQGKIQ
jgi:hypothetical protein